MKFWLKLGKALKEIKKRTQKIYRKEEENDRKTNFENFS